MAKEKNIENEKQIHLSKEDVNGFNQYREWMKEYEDLSAQLNEAYAEEKDAEDKNVYAESHDADDVKETEQRKLEAESNRARLEKELADLQAQSVDENLFQQFPENINEHAEPLTFENYLSAQAENGDKSAEVRLKDWQSADMIILDDDLKHEDIPEALAYNKKDSHGRSVDIMTEEELAQKEEQEREKEAEEEIKSEDETKHDRFVKESEAVSKSAEAGNETAQYGDV